jgi:hypothetical protein
MDEELYYFQSHGVKSLKELILTTILDGMKNNRKTKDSDFIDHFFYRFM